MAAAWVTVRHKHPINIEMKSVQKLLHPMKSEIASEATGTLSGQLSNATRDSYTKKPAKCRLHFEGSCGTRDTVSGHHTIQIHRIGGMTVRLTSRTALSSGQWDLDWELDHAQLPSLSGHGSLLSQVPTGYYILRKSWILKPRSRGSFRDLKFPRKSGNKLGIRNWVSQGQ